ncbi:SGNH hydrolase-type esterase domain-containing protein [Ampelomyces quisqualis]|uniref:SGNH hydrolase-type esterase domain-containing protein n=1 Tax=Ampelomyces quisqualis TaxID=50730 RepID=A0A6A5QM88_AMPQU|nr:SGNH hydrolase-type esterase domain-containing protein [Ampelomyces quisqualis]
MRFSILALIPVVLAAPAALVAPDAKPVYWLLAGDSTTAPNGGWGDAFLSTIVALGSTGHNRAKSGATTKSFRDGGYWNSLLDGIKQYKNDYRVYVTIQFGHNDQKANSGVNLAQFATNLGVMTDEVVAAGATPILVSPLTRRTFKSGKVVENLANETAIAAQVVKDKSRHYIDLNGASTTYMNAVGQAAADKYNLSPDDRTHLSVWGGVVFARIVGDLLVAAYPDEFNAVTTANATLTAIIKAGKAA